MNTHFNTPINTHFNVSDQELAAANGGAIGAVFKVGAKKGLKYAAQGVATWLGWEAAEGIFG